MKRPHAITVGEHEIAVHVIEHIEGLSKARTLRILGLWIVSPCTPSGDRLDRTVGKLGTDDAVPRIRDDQAAIWTEGKPVRGD